MKNFTFLILILFCRNTNLQAQNITLTEEEVKTILCHTWSLSSATIDGKPIPINIEFEVKFKEDNSYFLLSNPDAIGTWTYNAKDKYIELITKNRKARIGTLTKKEMIFIEMKTDEYQNATPQNSEFHFIRNE